MENMNKMDKTRKDRNKKLKWNDEFFYYEMIELEKIKKNHKIGK
jgi:hypothetical protein